LTNSQVPREAPFNGPISLSMTFGMPIPSSANKAEREHLKTTPTPHVRPGDIDNIQKTYLDTFNEILYKDDRQIFHVEAEKLYMEKPVVILDFKVYDPEVLTARQNLVLDEETEQYKFL
jgi:Holliday junction resolvase RusA-like endonuclease